MSTPDIKAQEAVNKLLKEGASTAEDQKKLFEALNDIHGRTTDYFDKQLEILNEIAAQTGTRGDTLAVEEAQLRKNISLLQDKLREEKAGTDEFKATIGLLQAAFKEQEKLNKRQAEFNEGQQIAYDGAQKMVKIFSLSGRTFQESLVGRAEKFGKSLKESPEKFKEGLTAAQPVASALSGIFDKIVESTLFYATAFDRLTSELNKSTGAAGEFNSVILDATAGTAAVGVGMEQAAAATGALYTEFTGFNQVSETTQKELIGTTATLEQVGVAASLTAESINFLTKGLGMSATEAAATQEQLAEFAKGIGVTPALMAENFKASQPIMVQYGSVVGQQVFEKLSKQAKATGIAFSDLLSITGQFDTFEGAANAAGKLNALLGGNLLNSVELLTASEEQRIVMLRNAVTQSGRSFASMNKFEKQSIAAAAGISDMTQAAKLFGTTDAEFAAVSEEQANLAEMAAKAQSMTDKLSQAAQRLAVALEPLVNLAVGFLDVMVAIVDNPVGNWFVKIAAGVGLAVTAFKLLGPLLGVIKLSLPFVGASAASAAPGITAMGAASAGASAPVAAFGAALSTLTVPIAAIALAIPLTIAAFAMLFQVIANNSEALGTIVGRITMMSLALGAFALASPFATKGAIAFAAGLGAISLAAATISGEKLLALGDLAQGLGSITEGSANAFAEAMSQLNIALTTANDVGTDTLAKATALVSAINQNALTIAAPAQGPAQTTQQTANPGAGMVGNTTSGPTTVVLQLNDREFARAVLNTFDKKLNLSMLS
jgi:hypothetical protein